MPRAAIIVKPSSRVDLTHLRYEVGRQERALGFATSLWLETSVESVGAEQAREALSAGVDLVVVAGGDGTITAVAEGLHGSGIPVGLIPAGTGNLFCLNLGLPFDLTEAVRVAFEGAVREVDVGQLALTHPDGQVERRSFLVMAGFGMDSLMVANTSPALKKRIGWLAYAEGIAVGLTQLALQTITYHGDDGAVAAAQVHTLIIGNCGTVQGKLRVLPRAVLDDGRLDVLAVGALHPRDQSRLALFLWSEDPRTRRIRRVMPIRPALGESRAFRYFRTRGIDVTLETPVPFQIDGDQAGDIVAVHAWIEPKALTVRVRDVR
ncbi:MAG: diacylglycerol/lipid kinase family protein [Coriobacteriia bacterium]